MTKVGKLVVGILLFVGLMTGVILQPDDGTSVQRPDGAGLMVDGANHAKPLPRPTTVADLTLWLGATVVALVLLRAMISTVRRQDGPPILRSQLFAACVVAPRGPPAHI